MPPSSPPLIFSPTRRRLAQHRAARLQASPEAARFLVEDMSEDVQERLAFLRHPVARALIVANGPSSLEAALAARGAEVTVARPAIGFAEELPYPFAGFDLIASLGTLDTVNDLPGALVHMRQALAPGGLLVASFVGAGSLPTLRAAMLAADGDRPASRIHPQVDVRAGAQLLQRAGFADPVADSRHLDVAYRSLLQLIADLRAQSGGNVLADPGPLLGRSALQRATDAFARAGSDGRTVERFEILTLSGWRR